MLRSRKGVKLWSGGDRPALPANSRESPLDADALRMCEMAAMADHRKDSFVVFLTVFSHASKVACAGRKWFFMAWERGASGLWCT